MSKSANSNQIIDHIKNLLAIETDSNLAYFLNIRPNAISAWRKRNTIPFKLIIDLAINNNWDLNKILIK